MPKNATIHCQFELRKGIPLQHHTAEQAAPHCRAKGDHMREPFSASMIMVAIAGAAVSTAISASTTRTSAQAPAASATAPAQALKTPWGEPDLQGIWTDETDIPLQRPAKYADQEFFTEAQRAELDAQRSALAGKDKR